ncbi:uncharacterized protein [Antedon mediterranea]|uniref:uncharacterized protein n=1 Tax=Antedon mediterranea TaxID=105859 RepID=UPI003AF50E5D
MFLRSSFTFILFYSFVVCCHANSGCLHNNNDDSLLCICESPPDTNWFKVNCNGRGLVHLPARIPENTTHLYLNNNNFTTIASDALLRLSELNEISLDFNNLTKLPKFPKKITTISASYNRLRCVDGSFTNLPRLDTIILNGNPIRKLTRTTFQGSFVRNIDISNSTLEQIEPFTFSGLQRINRIHLRETNIKELVENSFFFTSKSLIEIYVDNQLLKLATGAFANIPSGSRIYLTYSQITTIPARLFVNTTWLNTLRLEANKIGDIHPEAFKDLIGVFSLSVSSNVLTVFPSALYNLLIRESLQLDNNHISSLGNGSLFQSKYFPQYLYLDRNKIKTISKASFRGCKNLNILMLDHNEISYIEDGAFDDTDFEVMYLQKNKLETITNGTFRNGVMKKLYLFNNPITFIEEKSFSNMSNDSIVYLDCGQLTKIPSTLSGNTVVNCLTNKTKIIFDFFNFTHINYGMVCNKTKGICEPCKQGHYQLRQNNVKPECHACPPGGFYNDELGMSEEGSWLKNCKPCPNGSFSQKTGATTINDCQTCPGGTKTDQLAYLNACYCLDNFHRVDRFGECKPCPEGVDCARDFQQLLTGYWWFWGFDPESKEKYNNFITHLVSNIFNESNPDALKNASYDGRLPAVFMCPRSESCVGGIDANCSSGYTGWLCGACLPGYYELFNECHKCQKSFIMIILFAVIILIIAVIGYIVWRIDKRSIAHMGSFFTHMKIAINFYQILGILSELNEIHWPEDFQSVGQSLQYLDIIRYVNLLSPACILSGSWNAYTLLYIGIATPFVILILASTVCLLLHVINRYRGDYTAHRLKDKCLSITIMLMYLTYANSCSNIMAVGPWSIRTFNVTSDDNHNHTKKILTSDYSIMNLEDNNGSLYNTNKNIVFVSLLYVIGFPLAVVAVLYWKYKRNASHNEDINSIRPEIVGLKFFCKQYNSRFWYWEVFEMYNKAILSLIANFKDDEASNMSYSLFVTVILIALHLYLEPMKEKSDQRFQLLTLVFIIVNLSIGTIVDMDDSLYTTDDSIILLHEIRPFILLMLNLSILVLVFADLLKKVKESICERWTHQIVPDPEYNHESSSQIFLLNASSSDGI